MNIELDTLKNDKRDFLVSITYCKFKGGKIREAKNRLVTVENCGSTIKAVHRARRVTGPDMRGYTFLDAIVTEL